MKLAPLLITAALALCPSLGLAAGSEVLPVPSVTIYPGDIITDTMLADGNFVEGTAASLPVVAARADLTGKVARRTLLPGKLIVRNAISEPELVQKGAIIPAIYESGSLTITASVLALQSGALDQAIQARNVDSGKVVFGSVQADGSIRIMAQ